MASCPDQWTGQSSLVELIPGRDKVERGLGLRVEKQRVVSRSPPRGLSVIKSDETDIDPFGDKTKGGGQQGGRESERQQEIVDKADEEDGRQTKVNGDSPVMETSSGAGRAIATSTLSPKRGVDHDRVQCGDEEQALTQARFPLLGLVFNETAAR
ncbi:hypothetical protein ColLi_05556 [Colletotrichum liriopes]|uniref:Uncharacterized protein n=1 Tax=Colletotrichum liriopes TaxID=708192 RepID=A0AA37GM45_9PEZI|nr:hypothetical protein ColLi_05556 [Colletotrichum liriopes]